MTALSQAGKIIGLDTKGVRAARRSTSGVNLLDLDRATKSRPMTILQTPTTPHHEGNTLIQ